MPILKIHQHQATGFSHTNLWLFSKTALEHFPGKAASTSIETFQPNPAVLFSVWAHFRVKKRLCGLKNQYLPFFLKIANAETPPPKPKEQKDDSTGISVHLKRSAMYSISALIPSFLKPH